jgi:hypothetical protein
MVILHLLTICVVDDVTLLTICVVDDVTTLKGRADVAGATAGKW